MSAFLVLVILISASAWTTVVATAEPPDRKRYELVSKRLTLSLVVGGLLGSLLPDAHYLGAAIGTYVMWLLDKRFNWSDRPKLNP